jgi:putative YhdH/YhfP family quinone oxidoreductase
MKYLALTVRETDSGKFEKSIEERHLEELPDNEVLIRVHYAGLNYKDALSASGHKGITRRYPHTPGVDAAGVVMSDRSATFAEGSRVICTSYDLGMNTPGGFAQYIRVPAAWVLPLPQDMGLYESMVMGTAAFTAGLALWKMERCGQHPGMGKIVVSGASGGVGSMALGVLSRAGYYPVAATGKSELNDWLKLCGAQDIIRREEIDDTSGKPLLSSRWAGAIDNIGGNTLSTLLKGCTKEGCVASVGLVASADLNSSVYPFILNGVNLLGVDSAECAMELRAKIWQKLAWEWKPVNLEAMGRKVKLEAIPQLMEDMLRGQARGRIVAEIV